MNNKLLVCQLCHSLHRCIVNLKSNFSDKFQVHQYEFDEVDSDETNDCSELSPSFSFLGASGNSSFEDQITLDEETQIRLEALLEAAGNVALSAYLNLLSAGGLCIPSLACSPHSFS